MDQSNTLFPHARLIIRACCTGRACGLGNLENDLERGKVSVFLGLFSFLFLWIITIPGGGCNMYGVLSCERCHVLEEVSDVSPHQSH